MIRALPRRDRAAARREARRQWRAFLIPAAIVEVEGVGRALVIMRRLETPWSASQRRRLWRAPIASASSGDAPVCAALTDLDAPAVPAAGVSAPQGRSSTPALAAAQPEHASP